MVCEQHHSFSISDIQHALPPTAMLLTYLCNAVLRTTLERPNQVRCPGGGDMLSLRSQAILLATPSKQTDLVGLLDALPNVVPCQGALQRLAANQLGVGRPPTQL